MSGSLFCWASVAKTFSVSVHLITKLLWRIPCSQHRALGSSLDTAIWSTVEQGLAISAGSLATTRPFFRVLGEKFGLVTRPSASGYQDQPSGLGLSGLHSKGYGGSRSHTSPANNLTFRDDTHGYHVHVEAETNKAPGSEDGIVVTTHRMQTGHHPNESEEWLARSDGRSVGRDV